jgi:hypothetical protein
MYLIHYLMLTAGGGEVNREWPPQQ